LFAGIVFAAVGCGAGVGAVSVAGGSAPVIYCADLFHLVPLGGLAGSGKKRPAIFIEKAIAWVSGFAIFRAPFPENREANDFK
jgi:hypothetical protein